MFIYKRDNFTYLDKRPKEYYMYINNLFCGRITAESDARAIKLFKWVLGERGAHK